MDGRYVGQFFHHQWANTREAGGHFWRGFGGVFFLFQRMSVLTCWIDDKGDQVSNQLTVSRQCRYMIMVGSVSVGGG